MRRLMIALAALAVLALPVTAQIGKQVQVQAGTPEDKALNEISAASDPAKKLELLDKYLAEYGKGDMAIVFYELYVSHFLEQKDYTKAFEFGEKALAVDPDAFNVTFSLLRGAQDSGNVAKLFEYGDRLGGIVERHKAQPAPSGTDAEAWATQKASALESVASNLGYAQYTLYTTALAQQNPAQKAALLERYANAFPESAYSEDAATLTADSYRQAR